MVAPTVLQITTVLWLVRHQIWYPSVVAWLRKIRKKLAWLSLFVLHKNVANRCHLEPNAPVSVFFLGKKRSSTTMFLSTLTNAKSVCGQDHLGNMNNWIWVNYTLFFSGYTVPTPLSCTISITKGAQPWEFMEGGTLGKKTWKKKHLPSCICYHVFSLGKLSWIASYWH